MSTGSSHLASYLIRTVAVAGIAAMGMSLSGCSYLRSAAGMDKTSPDEFAVLTKGALTIPPDFGLMPPKPGEAPTNQMDPSSSAQATLFGANANPATIAAQMPGDASKAEKLLLAHAGADKADPMIRQHLTADVKSMLAADDSYTNAIMFWKEKKKVDPGKSVDADKEAKRILEQQQTGKNAPEAKEKEDRGWFDGWFDWF